MDKVEECELCGSDDYLNFHHLIPRTLHTTKKFKKLFEKMYMKTHGIWICKADCHRQIHRFITEKDMGMYLCLTLAQKKGWNICITSVDVVIW